MSRTVDNTPPKRVTVFAGGHLTGEWARPMTEQPVVQDDQAGALMSVIIAARNEEDYIGACLNALLEQTDAAGEVEVILAANACTDRTADVARACTEDFAARGWHLEVIDVPEPGKVNALNAADAQAKGASLIFLDADVRCDPPLLGQLREVLLTDRPLYATGTLKVVPPRTWITRRYAKFWKQLPFVKGGAVGAGLFAVNRAGRARWDAFPDIISDDTFVRMQFAPGDRVEVPAHYHWPMIEGFRNLVRVRRRQDAGVREIHQLYPEIVRNEAKAPVTKGTLARLLLTMPISFLVYALVHVAVRLRRSGGEWTRGR